MTALPLLTGKEKPPQALTWAVSRKRNEDYMVTSNENFRAALCGPLGGEP